MLFGIDTASVAGNKGANFSIAKAHGPLSFIFIRSNYGTQTDTAFRTDWEKARLAGLVRGAYLYLRHPKDNGKTKAPDPEAQALAMTKTVGDLQPTDLPPVIDVEFSGDGRKETGLTAGECLERVLKAYRVIKDFYGVEPIIYTSARVWKEDLDDLKALELLDCPLWLARYYVKSGVALRDPAFFVGGKYDPPVPTPWGDSTNWAAHQYQGNADSFPGFPGNVDMNRFNTMLRGQSGDRVKWLQRRLNLPQNGKFDQTTETAVRNFQDHAGLVADGIIGPKTFAEICWNNV